MADVMPPNMLNERPRTPAGLLSNREKDRLIERGFLGLYRWYTARSQETRNWNPDRSFDWRSLNKNLPPEVITVLEGFFAVEQYRTLHPGSGGDFMHPVQGPQHRGLAAA